MDNNQKTLKYQHTLIMTGAALIIFGIWRVIKWAMSILFAQSYMHSIIPDDILQDPALLIRVYAGLFLITGIQFLVQLYIGGSAIKDAHGTRKRQIPYLIAAGALIIYECRSLIRMFSNFSLSHLAVFDKILTGVEDIVVIAFAVELMIAAVRLRKYRNMHVTG